MNQPEEDLVLARAMGVIAVGLLVVLAGLFPLLAAGKPLTIGPAVLLFLGTTIMVGGISWWFSKRR